MPAEHHDDPGPALRRAAPAPRRPVDAQAIVARGDSLRRRRAAGRSALALLLVVPAVTGVLILRDTARTDLARGGDQGVVPATLSAEQDPPGVLADGSPAEPVPAAVAARFEQPVVGAARGGALPAGCSQASPAAADVERLRAAAGSPVVHVGPQTAASLAVGTAAAPPGYPGTFGVACLAVLAGGALETPGLTTAHLYRGWTGYVEPRAPGSAASWISALPVPRGAAWAVQEQPGWWLAYDVTGDGWLLAQVTQAVPDRGVDDVGFPGARVVFLDEEGRTVGEERLGREAIADDAPFLQPQTAAARIRFPDEAELRAELAAGPVPACAEDVTVCVWLTDVDGTIVALSAAGPVPEEVPPLGQVGWCAATGRFHGSGVPSSYRPDGTWAAGPSQTGLHRYEVTADGGQVVVDLSRFSFGPERTGAAAPTTTSCPDLTEPGFALP